MKIEENQEEPGSGRVTFKDLLMSISPGKGWKPFLSKTAPMGWGRAPKRFQRKAKAVKRDSRMKMKSPIPVIHRINPSSG